MDITFSNPDSASSLFRFKVVKGISWLTITQILSQALQIIIFIVLTRLLLPEDFGLIGLTVLVIVLLQSIYHLGITPAIIHFKKLNQITLSSLFWTTSSMGLILSSLAILLTPVISAFFHESKIEHLLPLVSLVVIFNSLSFIHKALLRKKLAYKQLSLIRLVSEAMFGIASISLALLGYGVWSLVAGQLLKSISEMVGLWIAFPWKPSLGFDIKAFVKIFNFGKSILGSQMVKKFGSNLDFLLIGKLLGTDSLGIYKSAFQLSFKPVQELANILSFPLLSAFSINSRNNLKLKRLYIKLIKYISLGIFPVLGGIAVTAPQFIPLVMGTNWIDLIKPLQLLCIAGALNAVGGYFGVLWVGKGEPEKAFRLNIINIAIVLLAILIGIKYGIIGVAWAWVIGTLLSQIIIQSIAFKFFNLTIMSFVKTILPALIYTSVLVLSVYGFNLHTGALGFSKWFSLITSILIGGLAYFLQLLIFEKSWILEMKNLLKLAYAKEKK